VERGFTTLRLNDRKTNFRKSIKPCDFTSIAVTHCKTSEPWFD